MPRWPTIRPGRRIRTSRAARSRRELERNRNISEERELEQNPLRPDQLTPGGNPRTAARRSDGDANSATPGDRLSAKRAEPEDQYLEQHVRQQGRRGRQFTGEPPRASLTEPPPGYQTPSPDQPYGLEQETTQYRPNVPTPEDHGALDGGR